MTDGFDNVSEVREAGGGKSEPGGQSGDLCQGEVAGWRQGMKEGEAGSPRCVEPCGLFRTHRGEKRRACQALRGLARWAGERRKPSCLRERLVREDWKELLRELVSYTYFQLRRWRWGGPLPLGFDARGIAAEAVARVFSGECRLSSNYREEVLKRELRRLVRGQISRLHKRVEVRRVRSEWGFLRRDENGHRQSIFKRIVGPELDGGEVMVAAEAEAAEERWYEKLERSLEGDAEALAVFRCMRLGSKGRTEIAERLGMSVEAVTNARKRVARKAQELKESEEAL